MKTKQPAVARLESGTSNLELETIVNAARALGAVVRIDVEPEEVLARERLPQRWWERDVVINPFGSEPPNVSFQLQVNNTFNVLVVNRAQSEAASDDHVWAEEPPLRMIPVPQRTLDALAEEAPEGALVKIRPESDEKT